MGQKEGKAPQNQREKKYLTAEGKKRSDGARGLKRAQEGSRGLKRAQEGSRGLKRAQEGSSLFFWGGTACGYYMGTLFRHLSQHLLECETKPLK
jgi:hypothetical protein